MNNPKLTDAVHGLAQNFRNFGLAPESTILAIAALVAWSQLSDDLVDDFKAPAFWNVNAELDEDGWRAIVALLKTEVRERSYNMSFDDLDGLAELPLAVIAATWQAARSALIQDANPQTRWRDFAIELLLRSPSWMGGTDDPSEVATMLGAALEVEPHSSIYCFGDATAALAIHWARQSHVVSIDLSNRRFALFVTLLAIGANAPLSVAVYNDGNVHPRKSISQRIVIAPPINAAVWGKPSERMPWAVDARLYDRLIDATVKRAVVIVPDGFLFRTTSSEQTLKHRLVDEFGLSAVVSLRKGQCAATIGCAALVHALHEKKAPGVLFVDGRAPGSNASDIADILKSRDERAISRLVFSDELEQNSFNLLVERYVRPAESEEYSRLFEGIKRVLLDEVADFSRPPVFSASKDAEGDQVIFEVANSDIQDGVIRRPKKKLIVDRQTYAKCKRAFLSPGDIVFSVKGRLGVVGLVTDEALSTAEGAWLPGQSFVTLRIPSQTKFVSPLVLAAILESPMIQDFIAARSVGVTVPSIQIGDVKTLAIPLLSRHTQENILVKLAEIDSLRRQRNEIEQVIADKRKDFWPTVLN